MDQVIRLRLRGMAPTEWVDAFEAMLKPGPADEAVQVISPGTGPSGLGALDPNVLSAIITGGAEVLAAIIAALAAVYVARMEKKREREPSSGSVVEVTLHGARDSEELSVSVAQQVPIAQLNETIGRIGQLREISI